jgi:hypothetical protein
MLERSLEYTKDSKIAYTVETETKVSKLFKDCIEDHQGALVGYLLIMNPSLT